MKRRVRARIDSFQVRALADPSGNIEALSFELEFTPLSTKGAKRPPKRNTTRSQRRNPLSLWMARTRVAISEGDTL